MHLLAIQQALAARSILATMPRVIESVGRSDFSSGLFDIARRFTGTEIVTAFVAAPDGEARTLLAENHYESGQPALDNELMRILMWAGSDGVRLLVGPCRDEGAQGERCRPP